MTQMDEVARAQSAVDVSVDVDTKPSPAVSEKSRARGRMAALDGVRGIAILIVMFNHFGSSAWEVLKLDWLIVADYSWFGVDLFLILSGFLITGILYDTREKVGYFRNFYARRFLRIVPLCFAAVIATSILTWFWPQELFGTSSRFWIFTFTMNYVDAFFNGSFGALGHLWTLSVEEHFYLIWPWIILYCSRERAMQVAAALIVLAIVSRIASTAYGIDGLAILKMTHTRMDTLAAGSLIALALRGPDGLNPVARYAPIAFFAGLLGCMGVVLVRRTFMAEDPIVITMGLFFTCLMFSGFLVGVLTRDWLNRILSIPILEFFGRYSYSMYVFHVPVLIVMMFSDITPALVDAMGMPAVLGASLLVTMGLSVLSYEYFEKPVLRLKRFFE